MITSRIPVVETPAQEIRVTVRIDVGDALKDWLKEFVSRAVLPRAAAAHSSSTLSLSVPEAILPTAESMSAKTAHTAGTVARTR